MKVQKRLIGVGALVLCLLASGCGLGGCSRTEPKPAAQPYAVVDMDELMHAHPAYSDYFRAEQEYRNLLAQYEAERQQLIRQSVQAQQELQATLGSGQIEKSLNTEFRARMTEREQMWNGRLNELYRQLLAREPQDDSWKHDIDLEIVNLQLKLRAVEIDPAERKEAEARLAELLDRRKAGNPAGATLSPESQAKLAALKAQAEADLKQYAAQLTEELRAKGDERARHLKEAAQARIGATDNDAWNAQWQQRIAAQQKAMQVIADKMTADIRAGAAKVAADKQYEVVFASYKANINAPNITTEVMANLPKTSEGGSTIGK